VLYGPYVAGWFFAAQKVVALPVQLISRAASDVFLGETPQFARNEPSKLQSMFNTYCYKALLWGAGPAAILMVTAPAVIPQILGDDWIESAKYLQILPLAYLAALAWSPINFAIIGRNDLSIVWSVARLILTAAAVGGAYVLNLGPIGAVAALSCSMAASYIVSAIMWNRALSKQMSIVKV
jgi:O-antigen/teichoic acid export membrane protein